MKNTKIKKPIIDIEKIYDKNPNFISSCSKLNASYYIASMPRSGSTAIANMLSSHSNKSLCLIEPGFHNGAKSDLTLKQIKLYSNISYLELKKASSELSLEQWYKKILIPILNNLNSWGLKEVRPELHLPTIKHINAKKIILTLRNLEETYISLLDKCHFDMLKSDFGYAKKFTDISIYKCTKEAIKINNKFNCLKINYSKSINSNEFKDLAQKYTGLNFNGEPNMYFDFLGRSREVKKQNHTKTNSYVIDTEIAKECFKSFKKSNEKLVYEYSKLLESSQLY